MNDEELSTALAKLETVAKRIGVLVEAVRASPCLMSAIGWLADRQLLDENQQKRALAVKNDLSGRLKKGRLQPYMDQFCLNGMEERRALLSELWYAISRASAFMLNRLGANQ